MTASCPNSFTALMAGLCVWKGGKIWLDDTAKTFTVVCEYVQYCHKNGNRERKTCAKFLNILLSSFNA
jgi:hypothetical protein